MEVRRTMKSMSVMEQENRKKLDFMIPMDIPGRYQLMTKLKDLVINVDNVVVKPIHSIPTVIRDSVGFFSTDGFWVGNFIAYGKNLKGDKTLLWDDFGIPDIDREPNAVLTKFIKERLSSTDAIVIVTAKEDNKVFSLEFYCYLP